VFKYLPDHGYSLLRTQLNNDYFHDLFNMSVEFQIPIEGHRTFTVHPDKTTYQHVTDTETGPGVLETALAYTSALRMADNALLYKFLAKSIGMKHGVVPSFMAKPWGNVRDIHFVSLEAIAEKHWSFLAVAGQFLTALGFIR